MKLWNTSLRNEFMPPGQQSSGLASLVLLLFLAYMHGPRLNSHDNHRCVNLCGVIPNRFGPLSLFFLEYFM